MKTICGPSVTLLGGEIGPSFENIDSKTQVYDTAKPMSSEFIDLSLLPIGFSEPVQPRASRCFPGVTLNPPGVRWDIRTAVCSISISPSVSSAVSPMKQSKNRSRSLAMPAIHNGTGHQMDGTHWTNGGHALAGQMDVGFLKMN